MIDYKVTQKKKSLNFIRPNMTHYDVDLRHKGFRF